METKATCWFRDKDTRRLYAPGSAYSGSPARVRELEKAGYVEAVRPARPQDPAQDEEQRDGTVRD